MTSHKQKQYVGPRPVTRSTDQSARGFTVVEMMVVVALIAILVSIVIVSMSRISQSASRTDTLGSLRQLAAGYNAYIQDHRSRLMPGYIDPEYVQQLRINARRPDGVQFFDDFTGGAEQYEDLSSYVWRLAPYLDFNLNVMMTDYESGSMVSSIDAALGGPDPNYGPSNFANYDVMDNIAVSMVPSFGLNSIFLGGDTRHGGSYATSRHPWVEGDEDTLAATRFTEVRNPAQIIVFAPVGHVDTNLGPDEPYTIPNWADNPVGYPELRPPFIERTTAGVWTADHRQWRVGQRGRIDRLSSGSFANGAGLPILRHGEGVLPVAHLDGSARSDDIELLSSDMRRWAPQETGMSAPQVELD